MKANPDRERIFVPLLDPLHRDIEACAGSLHDMNEDDKQFARRTYLRALFAFFEAALEWLRPVVTQFVLGKWPREGTIKINVIFLLQQTTPRLTATGKIKTEPARIPFRNWCAFVFRAGIEAHGGDADKRFSDNGWREMQRALDVRHRLTHPKQAAELAITDEELESARLAYVWFFNCLVDLVNTALEAEEKNKSQQ